MNIRELKELISNGESERLEFKRSTGQRTDAAKVAVAMCDDHLEITNPGALHFGITPEKLTKPHESKPWNPIIANVFYRAGIIERWGNGTLNIVDWCDENGNPPPAWSEQAGSVFVTFTTALGETTPQVTEQVTEQVGRLVEALGEDALAGQEVMERLGLSHRPTLLYSYLRPAIEAGLVEMTVPDKPRSSKQKYKLTSKGREMVRGLKVQGSKFED